MGCATSFFYQNFNADCEVGGCKFIPVMQGLVSFLGDMRMVEA